jgi:CrcB protein
MIKVLLVALGGAVGSVFRYLIGAAALMVFPKSFPIGTLLVNIVGAFIIGVLSEFAYKVTPIDSSLYVFITIGILGGFTTFSSFSLESVNMLEAGRVVAGVAYILASVMLSLGGVLLGKMLIRGLY